MLSHCHFTTNTAGAPVVEDVEVSRDEGYIVITWTLNEEFLYTTQFIQKCNIDSYIDISCMMYPVKHGESARLPLEQTRAYALHLLLHDLDEEVYRELVYLTETELTTRKNV